MLVLGLSKANTIRFSIKCSVVRRHKDISQDPKRALWWWYVQRHDCLCAALNMTVVHSRVFFFPIGGGDDVVLRVDLVLLAIYVEN
jgi:hypothetical protein